MPPKRNGPQDGPAQPSTKSAKKTFDWDQADNLKGFMGNFRVKRLKPGQVPESEQPRKKRKVNQSKYAAEDLQYEPNKTQASPYEDSTMGAIHYRIEPNDIWMLAGRYRKFTVQEAIFRVNDYVYIRAHDDEDDPDAAVRGWIAKVLEVRAGNENHVYLRVYWMYRPEDLPEGRQSYHGWNELIASNDMAVIDAMTVEGRAPVMHWVEDSDENEVLNPAQLFWRQTLDYSEGGGKKPKLSKLRLHCTDQQPTNPDKLLIQCDSCGKWLHASCLEAQAVRDAYKTHNIPYPGDSGASNTANTSKRRTGADEPASPNRGRPKTNKKAAKESPEEADPPLVDPTDLTFSAELIAEEGTRMLVTDKRSGHAKNPSFVDVTCLLCGGPVDQGKDTIKAESVNKEDEVEGPAPPETPPNEGQPTSEEDNNTDSVMGDVDENKDSASAEPSLGAPPKGSTELLSPSPSRFGSPAHMLNSTSAAVSAGVRSISELLRGRAG